MMDHLDQETQERIGSLKGQIWKYVWSEHQAWLARHDGSPAMPRRFYKDELLSQTDATKTEKIKLWSYVFDELNAREEEHFLTYDPKYSGNGVDEGDVGAFVISTDPMKRVTKDVHCDKVADGMFKSRRRRTVRMIETMGEQEFLKQLKVQGVNPKLLAQEGINRGRRFPDKAETLMLDSGETD